ncbi:MAG: TIGR03857 family LLM class F420-dependent oxidoreductase, partial [Deltaproteobacteria bacterium]|nr:TIGR03857 family LLM class F420-dependent oxidoreductase [Deltaproteobacteria bacterium]
MRSTREPAASRFPELGCYLLAGQPKSPRDLIEEARDAEALGLGTAFISERYQAKEAATLCGAAGAVTQSIRIATAATNHNTRHPMVSAGYALTMHGLTGGRFVFGIGRGIEVLQKAYGIPLITTAQMESFVELMRKLLAGEAVVGYDGPLGSYPFLRLGPDVADEVPMLLVAFGPNSLALGGRCFDEVVLHTFFTDETTARAVRVVKQAAEKQGRNPDDVKVWSCFATIGDHIEPERRL